MRRTFGRYLTDEVVSSLLETPSGLQLGGERRKVTVLISDLRGFSAISERLPPEQVVTILNLYLGAMSDVISHYQGTINEFIGDGIFVMFGAPIQREDDAQRAIACAIAMQTAMGAVNQQNKQQGFPPLEMGIGINTGEMIVGNIGSQKRAKYTVIGNHANLAARIESYSVGRQILISEHTLNDASASQVQVSAQMRVEPKGIREPLSLYEVRGIKGHHEIFLPEEKETFVLLPAPIPLQFIVLEGKHVVGTVFQGSLVQLSENGAELQSDTHLMPLSNLKINLLISIPEADDLDLYAKVLNRAAETPGCVRIRFTATPPELIQLLDGLHKTYSD
jgi:adenylate cyclase